jgi:ATPase subunit of ABC transporter with duplicated ATPase domains
MTIFTLRSIKKDFGIKELLTDASFSLDEGDKVGLIGTNGSGKSTLLKMIAVWSRSTLAIAGSIQGLKLFISPNSRI